MSVLPMTRSAGCKIRVCDKHGEFESKPYQAGGRIFFTICPGCDAEATAQQEGRKREQEEQRYFARLTSAGISKRFINCSFDGYRPASETAGKVLAKVRTYCDKFEKLKEAGTSMVMCGRPGTGKTHLANALAISLIEQGVPVTYTTSFKMMARIKATYNKFDAKETESGVIDTLTTRDLLIIDEVGVQFGSEAEKVLFYQVINGRYDNVLPTVLISNLTAKELEQFIGERCYDRLREGSGAVLSFDWESYRK